MRRCATVLLLSALPLPLLRAQGADDRPRAEMAQVQRQLQQNRGEVERLIDMRLRHDLGLPAEDDPTAPRPSAPITTEQKERLLQEWRDQDAATASLLERYNKLKGAVESLRIDAAERARSAPREESFVVVPQAGTAQTTGRRAPVEAVDNPGPGAVAEPRTAASSVSSAPSVITDLDPIRGQIHGSRDHLRVAQSLFKAGQALVDRARDARAQNQIAAADELDARGKERLTRALEELKPLLGAKEPPYAALFYQGRCRELLFRWSENHEDLSLARSTKDYQRREQEVREPFLAISARDVSKVGKRGETEVLGPWGMAAQAAMEHFRWMNLHAGYKPRTPIESLTWPGEKDQ